MILTKPKKCIYYSHIFDTNRAASRSNRPRVPRRTDLYTNHNASQHSNQSTAIITYLRPTILIHSLKQTRHTSNTVTFTRAYPFKLSNVYECTIMLYIHLR